MNRNSNLFQFEFSKVKNEEWYLVTYVLLNSKTPTKSNPYNNVYMKRSTCESA